MSTLRTLFTHNDWARDMLMGLAAPLNDEQLDRPYEIGLGSLRRILTHLWACEQHWLNRWRGIPGLDEAPHLGMEELWSRFRTTAGEREMLFDSRGEAGFSTKISFADRRGTTRTFPLGDMALHVSNHGIHHRAQALNILRRLDVKPPGLDFLHMCVARPTVKQDDSAAAKLVEMDMKPGESLVPPAELDVETIREYCRYSDWATLLVCDIAAKMSDENLDHQFEMGVGTLRKTLLHIYDAEAWWCANWIDGAQMEFKQLPPSTTIPDLKSLLVQVFERRDGYFAGLTSADLQNVVEAHASPELCLRFRLGESMLQLPTHGTHHRAQCRNMLRRLGVETPEIDYLDWYDATQR